MEWQSLIRSYNAQNITITGGGTIDGRGQPWWTCKHTLADPPCNGISRPQLIRLVNTIDVVIHDIKMKDSPSWTLHLANTTNVHVYGVTFENALESPNTDGIDIDCSVNVLVENCSYVGNDGAIVVKSGINYLGRTFGRTTENVIVRNFTVGVPGLIINSGLSIGSEMSGGVRNVTFEDCTMYGSTTGVYIKSERVVENITYSNIHLYDVPRTIDFMMNFSKHYIPPTNETATPKSRNIIINGFYADNSLEDYFMVGLNESVITNVSISNVQLNNTLIVNANCTDTTGFCDSYSVFPSCPTCLDAQLCVDESNDCSNYLGQCSNSAYRKPFMPK